MPTDYECAYYAREVNKAEGGVALPGWEIRKARFPQNRWNFGMASYYHKDSKSLIIAFRGTENLWDLVSDYGLWHTHVHPNQAYADNLAINTNNTQLTSLLLGELFAKILIEDRTIVEELLKQIVVLIAASLATTIAIAGGSISSIGFSAPLQALLGSTAVATGIGIAAYTSLIQRLISSLRTAMLEKESEIDFVKLLGNALKKEEEQSTTSIIFVGHSMGAYIAEMCSCRLKQLYPNTPIEIKAVTFDSPGSLDTLNGIEEYKLPNYNHIRTYLTAPNLVNTCHRHAGEVRRIYIPHVEDNWTWSHFGYSLWQSAGRIALYTAIPTGIFTGGILPAVAGAGGALISQAVAQGLHIITKDQGWLQRQHNMQNILTCFSQETGLPKYYSVMQEWPHSSSIFTMGLKQAERYLKNLWPPFPADAPGIRTMFWENHMNELQSQALPGYQVNKDVFADIKDIPDWAKYSLERYQEKAKQGDAEAQFNLGVMYETGLGVEKNDNIAMEWYLKAANQGNADAQFNLGVMYKNGRGVEKNDVMAAGWFRKSLAMKEQEFGKEDWQVAFILAHLANTHGDLGNTKIQKALLERSLAIQEKHYGKNHYQIALTLENLGIAKLNLSENKDAFEDFKRAYHIFLQHFGAKHANTQRVKNSIEKCCPSYFERVFGYAKAEERLPTSVPMELLTITQNPDQCIAKDNDQSQLSSTVGLLSAMGVASVLFGKYKYKNSTQTYMQKFDKLISENNKIYPVSHRASLNLTSLNRNNIHTTSFLPSLFSQLAINSRFFTKMGNSLGFLGKSVCGVIVAGTALYGSSQRISQKQTEIKQPSEILQTNLKL